MNQNPYGPPPGGFGGPPGGGYGPPPGGGYGPPPGGGFGPPGGGFGAPPGGFGPPPGGGFGPPGGGYGAPNGFNNGGASTLATVALVSGILSITFCGFLAGLPAIITGIMGYQECQRDPSKTGQGLAIAGIVLGVLSLGISAIFLSTGLLSAFLR